MAQHSFVSICIKRKCTLKIQTEVGAYWGAGEKGSLNSYLIGLSAKPRTFLFYRNRQERFPSYTDRRWRENAVWGWDENQEGVSMDTEGKECTLSQCVCANSSIELTVENTR